LADQRGRIENRNHLENRIGSRLVAGAAIAGSSAVAASAGRRSCGKYLDPVQAASGWKVAILTTSNRTVKTLSMAGFLVRVVDAAIGAGSRKWTVSGPLARIVRAANKP